MGTFFSHALSGQEGLGLKSSISPNTPRLGGARRCSPVIPGNMTPTHATAGGLALLPCRAGQEGIIPPQESTCKFLQPAILGLSVMPYFASTAFKDHDSVWALCYVIFSFQISHFEVYGTSCNAPYCLGYTPFPKCTRIGLGFSQGSIYLDWKKESGVWGKQIFVGEK